MSLIQSHLREFEPVRPSLRGNHLPKSLLFGTALSGELPIHPTPLEIRNQNSREILELWSGLDQTNHGNEGVAQFIRRYRHLPRQFSQL